MTFTVACDANVLYPSTLRDLLIRSRNRHHPGEMDDAILDEMLAALSRNRPDIPPARLGRLRDLMNDAIRDALVAGYEPLIEGLKLPDPDDRHVLAAAIKSGAQVIVTRNLKDFPAADLEPWNVEAKSPDAFILDQLGIIGRIIASSRRHAIRTLRNFRSDQEKARQPARWGGLPRCRGYPAISARSVRAAATRLRSAGSVSA